MNDPAADGARSPHVAPLSRAAAAGKLASRLQGIRALLLGSLFARVTLVMLVGLALAQTLTFALVRYERGTALRELMMSGIERDIASSIALLDRLPAAERAQWLGRLARPNYRFVLRDTVAGEAPSSASAQAFAAAIANALQPFRVVQVAADAGTRDGLRLQVRLSDGSDVVVDAHRVAMPVSGWVTWVLWAQLAVLGICGWCAVRLVTRPLAQLAEAADGLGPDLKTQPLPEEGPTEVVRATRAFNAMQRRISGYISERVEILAAISHDLQTPITRMRLRADMLDNERDQVKFRQDLDAMQALVREGVTYARTLHGTKEPPCRIDADALFESIVSDYEDAGQAIRLDGRIDVPILTRPNALRRIVVNLVDNALKFGSEVSIRVRCESGELSVSVLDNGPGIPPEQLEAVLRPFHRVERSRNRSTGGTGLGLAIAQQLAGAMNARLSLHNRREGGLEARLSMSTRLESMR